MPVFHPRSSRVRRAVPTAVLACGLLYTLACDGPTLPTAGDRRGAVSASAGDGATFGAELVDGEWRSWFEPAASSLSASRVGTVPGPLLSLSGTSATITGRDWGGEDLTLADGDVLSGSFTNVGTFRVPAGARAYVRAGVALEVAAAAVVIEGTLDGTGSGAAGGTTATTGSAAGEAGAGLGGGHGGRFGSSIHGPGGGGGGYGGAGGGGGQTLSDPAEAAGGVTYGSEAGSAVEVGSGGGSAANHGCASCGLGGRGGAGGAAIVLVADRITVAGGEILAKGANGSVGVSTGGTAGSYVSGGGAGSGGGIRLEGKLELTNAVLRATGGNGGNVVGSAGGYGTGGGGGGGGRIKLGGCFVGSPAYTAEVTGGAPGAGPASLIVAKQPQAGAPGTVTATDRACSATSNAAPTASAGVEPYTGVEGSSIAFSASGSSDPEGTALTYAWDLNDDGEYGDPADAALDVSGGDAAGVGAARAFGDDGAFTVGVRVTDAAGAADEASAQVSVANVSPVVSGGPNVTIPEGSTFTRSGSFTDPGNDLWAATVDYGTGAGPVALDLRDKSFLLGHTFAASREAPFTVVVTVAEPDVEQGAGSDTVLVTVKNVAPKVRDYSLSGPVVLRDGSAVVTISGVDVEDPAGPADEAAVSSVECGNGTAATRVTSGTWECKYDSVGAYPVAVRATDKDGGVSDALPKTARVVYDWSGFFQPVDKGLLNTAKAGSAVPLKFTLGGNQGMAVIAAGYPIFKPIACGVMATDDIEETASVGSSGLHYDATTDQYNYVWKTDEAWAATSPCGQLVLKLTDGTFHYANFQFVR